MKDEAAGAGLSARVGEGEAGKVGDFDFAAVDGEAHGDERGEECDNQHRKRAENDIEEAVDAGDSHCTVRINGECWAGMLVGDVFFD